MQNLFTPMGPTVNVTAATTVGGVSVALGVTLGSSCRVKNLSTDTACFIAFGNSAVTVTAANGIPIGPGDLCGFSIGPAVTHVTAITGTGTAAVYFTPGNGE